MQNISNQQGTPLQIDPNTLEDVACKECGHLLFDTAVKMKRISAIQSPTGKSELIQIQVNVCRDCGTEVSTLELAK
jgi:predicted Zn-ribbon and HTH transcriptional regulator